MKTLIPARTGRRMGIDLKLDAQFAARNRVHELQFKLPAQRVVLEHSHLDRTIGPTAIHQLGRYAKFLKHLGYPGQDPRPAKARVRRLEDKIKILREPRQAIQNPQAGTSLEGSQFEEIIAPQGVQNHFLQDFLQRLCLLRRIRHGITRQSLLQQLNHDPTTTCPSRRLPASSGADTPPATATDRLSARP